MFISRWVGGLSRHVSTPANIAAFLDTCRFPIKKKWHDIATKKVDRRKLPLDYCDVFRTTVLCGFLTAPLSRSSSFSPPDLGHTLNNRISKPMLDMPWFGVEIMTVKMQNVCFEGGIFSW